MHVSKYLYIRYFTAFILKPKADQFTSSQGFVRLSDGTRVGVREKAATLAAAALRLICLNRIIGGLELSESFLFFFFFFRNRLILGLALY